MVLSQYRREKPYLIFVFDTLGYIENDSGERLSVYGNRCNLERSSAGLKASLYNTVYVIMKGCTFNRCIYDFRVYYWSIRVGDTRYEDDVFKKISNTNDNQIRTAR